MFETILTIIMAIIIIAGIAIVLLLALGFNILSFLSGILTSPIFWVLVGIIVVVAFWWHEKS